MDLEASVALRSGECVYGRTPLRFWADPGKVNKVRHEFIKVVLFLLVATGRGATLYELFGDLGYQK